MEVPSAEVEVVVTDARRATAAVVAIRVTAAEAAAAGTAAVRTPGGFTLGAGFSPCYFVSYGRLSCFSWSWSLLANSEAQ